MISNSVKKGPVRVERETDRASRTPDAIRRNQHHRDNVNVPMGPRMGNPSVGTKRADFVAAKAEREPLAAMIQDAYAARQHEYADFEYTNGGSIHDNTRAEFKKRTK
jgi:hypothetical protein